MLPLPRRLRPAEFTGWVPALLLVASLLIVPPVGPPAASPTTPHAATGTPSGPRGIGEHAAAGPSAPLLNTTPGIPSPRLAARAPPGSDWGTFRYDDHRTASNTFEVTLAPSNISGLRRLWEFDTTGAIEGSPTVVAGRVYVGAWDGYEYALNASNGTLAWKTYIGVTTGTCTYAPEVGVTSSAAVVNGTLYVGGGDSYWYALNLSTGRILGKVYTGPTGAVGGYYNWASPLIVGHMAYIGLASECDSPMVQGALLMVNISDPANLTNSSIVHRFNAVPNGFTGASIWGTPAYDAGTDSVYIATGNYGSYTGSYSQAIVALNASNLKVRGSWQILNTPNSDSDFSAGPLLFNGSGGGLYAIAANKDGFDYAVNASNVSAGPVWSQRVANPRCGFAPAAFGGGRLYLAGGCDTVGSTTYPGSVRAVLADNRTAWVHYTPGYVLGGATYAGGLVIDAAENASVNLTGYSFSTTLEFLNASTGNRIAQMDFPQEALNSTITVSDGRVYLGLANQTLTDGGTVVALGLPLNLTVVTSGGTPADAGTVNFSARISGGSPPDDLRWTLGDGSTASSAAFSHTYSSSGNYTVALQVVDALGDVANWSGAVNVAPSPSIAVALAVTPVLGTTPLAVAAHAAASGGSGPYSYSWSFGDGADTTTVAGNVVHTYSSAGTFALVVNVSDGSGVHGGASTSVVVALPLAASASANRSTGEAPFAIESFANPREGFPPYTASWSWGDGSPQTGGVVANHTYVAIGDYMVIATVRDSQGDSAASTFTVDVLPVPIALNVSYTAHALGCSATGAVVTFNATAVGGIPPYAFEWSFGDGASTVDGPLILHTFLTDSNGPTTVTVYDQQGTNASATLSPTWTVPPCPPPATHSTSAPHGLTLPIDVLAGAVVLALGAILAAAWVVHRRRARTGASPDRGRGTAGRGPRGEDRPPRT